MNIITLMGRLGKDPETRTVGSTNKTTISVATTEKWKDQNGNAQERTDWHNVEAWAKQGEVIANHFKKGDQILLTGQVRYDEHEGKWYTHIRMSSFEFVGGGNRTQEQQPAAASGGGADLPF
jgi:single-strand DNA-binding protein